MLPIIERTTKPEKKFPHRITDHPSTSFLGGRSFRKLGKIVCKMRSTKKDKLLVWYFEGKLSPTGRYSDRSNIEWAEKLGQK